MIFPPILIYITPWLLYAVWSDVKERKVSNKFIILFLIFSLVIVLKLYGFSALSILALSFFVTFLLMIPTFLLRILGGGDIKLILVLSLYLSWLQSCEFIIYSFCWGALFGLIKTGLDRRLNLLFFDTLSLIKKQKNTDTNSNPIPFTVAIMLGFYSEVVALALGVSIL
jgi:prepilin peptidase CpaA